MFVALTFLAFLMIDVLTKTPFHPVHYTLVGFALLLFYLLLLSLSEYMFFDASYACAAAAVILLIGGYTRGVTRRWPLAGTMSFLLTVLYALLYVLLQLEDYALLVGSLGLLAILAIVMYITRKIDWFTIGRPQAP
jgi:inner membrane protein